MPRPRSLLLALFALACAEEAPRPVDDPVDGENDSFGAGKADSPSESCPVLKLVNSADFETLDLDVGLNVLAVEGIVAHRQGLDGALGTADDPWFATLDELDAVPYVGPAALEALEAYVDQTSLACGEVAVQLLSFNDFHGNLQPPAGSSGQIWTGSKSVTAGGVEFMGTHVQRLAAENPNTVVVAAGDLIGATPLLSALFHDEPTVEAMNLLGLEISSVGNHEFDEGPDELLRMQLGGCHPADGCLDGDGFDGARYHYLSANVFDRETGATLLPPYEIRRFGNASIAFVGMTLEDTPLVTVPSGVASLEFRDEAETVNALVPELRARGVEAIVVLLHEGGLQSGLFDECVGISGPLLEIVQSFDDAIDVVVAGHTHTAHVCDIDGRIVTSAASGGRMLTDIDLVVDEATGDIVSRTAENVIVTRDVAPAPEQTALIAHYQPIATPLSNRVVGRIEQSIRRGSTESAMGDLITDAQREAGSADAAFANSGGIRADLIFEQISGGEAPGEVTYGEVFAVQPFSNNLVTMSLTGAQIDALLEQQWSLSEGTEVGSILQVSASVRYSWDSARPIGDRVDPADVTIGGQPLDLDRSYRVAVGSFLAEGGSGFTVFREGTERSGGPLDIDALEAYLAAHSPYVAPPSDRITRL